MYSLSVVILELVLLLLTSMVGVLGISSHTDVTTPHLSSLLSILCISHLGILEALILS